MRKIGAIAFLFVAFFFWACASHHPVEKKATSHGIDYRVQDTREFIWSVVRKEVIPQLKNCEFMHSPTLIVSGNISGTATIAGEIDGLTRMIREAIIIELVKIPGFPIVQRHRLMPVETPGRIPKINPSNYTDPQYYLILDIRMGQSKVYVNIFAIEVGNTNMLLPGFSIFFSLSKNREMEQLYKDRRWDEYLEGTKHLPIREGDKDAIAAYIGYNLVCLVNDIYFPRNSVFYVDGTGLLPYETAIIGFFNNYLTQYGVPVTDNRDTASHILVPTSDLSGDIFIFWVRIMEKEMERIVPYSAMKVYYKKKH